MREAPEDWRRFEAATIPSKESTPLLDGFLEAIRAAAPEGPPLTLLDVGCGSGRLGRRLHERGFSVLGVDVNADAIDAARKLAAPCTDSGRWLRFEEADCAAQSPPAFTGGPFDVGVCQLVLSIIGGVDGRQNLLRNVRANLRPGGWMYLSASGVSDTINPGYARLYAEDVHVTGERHTYLSRNERGEVLYMTHHFTADELVGLLEAAGFGDIRIVTEQEASSRRPDEVAYFHYVTCRTDRSFWSEEAASSRTPRP